MNSLQTKEITQYIDSRDWPKGIKYSVADKHIEIDETTRAQWLQFILYRSNMNSLTGEEVMLISNIVQELFMKLRTDGVPIYLEVMA